MKRKGRGHGPKTKDKRRTGRPSLLSDEVSATICEAVTRHVPLKYAAAMAGVSYDAVNEWVSRGNDPTEEDPRFAKFRRDLHTARGEKVRRLAQTLEDASKIPNNITGQLDWKAALALLERGEPEYFQPRKNLEVSGKQGAPVFDLGALVGAAADRLSQIESGEVDPEKDD